MSNDFVEKSVYLHSSKDSMRYELEQEGLSESAVQKLAYLFYEVEFKVRAHKKTGDVEILYGNHGTHGNTYDDLLFPLKKIKSVLNKHLYVIPDTKRYQVVQEIIQELKNIENKEEK